MGNTTNANWDEASPALTDPRRDGAQEIRVLRGAVRTRLLKEHTAPAAIGVGGEHLEGSARSYRVATAPTLKPDGVTALDTNDKGRLWVDSDDNQIYSWTGSAWVLIGDLPITVIDYARWSKGSVDCAGLNTYRRISGSCTQAQASSGGWDTATANGVRLTTGTYLVTVNFHVDQGSASSSTPLSGSKFTFTSGTPASQVHMLDGTDLPYGNTYQIKGKVVITAASGDFEFFVKADTSGITHLTIPASEYHFEKVA